MSWSVGTSAPKRFYTSAEIAPLDGAWTVLLDDRPLRTPAKTRFRAPEAVALAAAAEWEAQAEAIDPATMPVTRAVNSALDRVAPQREAVINDIAGYGGTDLLCYRATHPDVLIERQRASWNPPLAWASESFGAPLEVTSGVMSIPQPAEAAERLRDEVARYSNLGLTALHDLVGLSGSLILGLAVAHRWMAPDAAWAASRIDETWQSEQWGVDAEAEALAEAKLRDFCAAARLMEML